MLGVYFRRGVRNMLLEYCHGLESITIEYDLGWHGMHPTTPYQLNLQQFRPRIITFPAFNLINLLAVSQSSEEFRFPDCGWYWIGKRGAT